MCGPHLLCLIRWCTREARPSLRDEVNAKLPEQGIRGFCGAPVQNDCVQNRNVRIVFTVVACCIQGYGDK